MNDLEAVIQAITQGAGTDQILRTMSVPQLVDALGGTRATSSALGVSQRTAQRWKAGTQAPSGRTAARRRLETAVLTQNGVSGTLTKLTREQRRSLVPKQIRDRIKGGGTVPVSMHGDVTVQDSTRDTRTRTIRCLVPASRVRAAVNGFIAGDSARVERLVYDALFAYGEPLGWDTVGTPREELAFQVENLASVSISLRK